MIYGNEEKNIPGALSKGYDEQELLKLKEEWIKFGSYCFNKSHSVAYAKVSFQTAWLKCYYYIYFMAALISNTENKKDKKKEPKHIKYQKELKENGIQILPPHIVYSKNYWTPIQYEKPIVDDKGNTFYGEIRFSLTSIAGVTDNTYESLQRLDLNGIASFEGWLRELDRQKAIRQDKKDRIKVLTAQLEIARTRNNAIEIENCTKQLEILEEELRELGSVDIDKTVIENLIKAGAFDCYSRNRCHLLAVYAKYRGDFEEAEQYPKTTLKRHVMVFEKDTLGCVASFESKWDSVKDGEIRQFTGSVKEITPWTAKSSGKVHYYITLDIGGETIQCTMWGYMMKRYENQLNIGSHITVKGEKGYNRLTINSIQIQ